MKANFLKSITYFTLGLQCTVRRIEPSIFSKNWIKCHLFPIFDLFGPFLAVLFLKNQIQTLKKHNILYSWPAVHCEKNCTMYLQQKLEEMPFIFIFWPFWTILSLKRHHGIIFWTFFPAETLSAARGRNYLAKHPLKQCVGSLISRNLDPFILQKWQL